MEQKPKIAVKNSVVRVIVVAVLLLVQIGWFLLLFLRLSRWSVIVQIVFGLAAFGLLLFELGREQNGAYKLLWTIILLAMPTLGIFLFLLIEGSIPLHFARRHFEEIDEGLAGYVPPRPDELVELAAASPVLANQARYLADKQGGIPAPLYRCPDVRFYAEAADGFEAQLADIATARSFVFLEYHAIEDSVSFARLKALLAEKVAEGVEVRVIYDDLGSFGFISRQFIRGMEAVGVQCRVFNPLVPVLSALMNNRDHRKITVVDGCVGFTGGYNLADEYFNITHPYGEWKDTGIRLEGPAVRSLTATFLELWNEIRESDHGAYERYFPEARELGVGQQASAEWGSRILAGEGWVQPYADSPLDRVTTAEDVYLNVIKGATSRLWATTPYLIITDEMTRELVLAARRGVDVRIVTPGIPDKKMIYRLTRSYYAQLARHGVRIYEWTPGFIHAKQMLADDQVATVGTINLDYRSLYLHFENGCVLYRCPALVDIEADFEGVFAQSTEVSAQYANERTGALKLGRCILRLLAPLM